MRRHTLITCQEVNCGVGKNILDSKMRDLLRGLGTSAKRQEEALDAFWNEVFIGTTEEYIGDFERAVGIPDDCFPGTGTLDERRTDVTTKMVLLYVITEQDFIDLAATYGIVVEIVHDIDTVNPPYDVPFTPPDPDEARFQWTIKGNDLFTEPRLLCLFCKLNPALARLTLEDPNVTITLPAYDVPFGPTGNFIQC